MRRPLIFALLLVALVAPEAARAARETLVLRSQAIAMKPYEVVQDVIAVPSPRVDGYVVGMSVQVVDTAGRVQTDHDVMLHHAVFAKAFVPDYTCSSLRDLEGRPSPLPAERFYGAGEENLKLDLPDGYGYPNRATDIWGLVYMLMNHRNRASTVYVRYHVEYVTGETLTPVKPVWLDVVNCSADPIFTVPGTGGRSATFARAWEFTMPESGRLVAAGGHLHGGGLRLELRNASCGDRELFTSRPAWRTTHPMPIMHEPGPSHMTGFSSTPGIPVRAGERLRLRAVYDNTRPHMRVMGILLTYFAADPRIGACEAVPPLPVDPLFDPPPPPHVHQPLLRRPRGKVARVRSTWVGDYRFGHELVQLRRGQTFRWRFLGAERHDVTLANGPEGLASPGVRRGSFSFRFRKAGRYDLYCSLHPTRMTQRVIVR